MALISESINIGFAGRRLADSQISEYLFGNLGVRVLAEGGRSPEPCALDIESNPSPSDSDSHGLSRVLSVMYNSRYRPRPSVLLATALI